MRLKVSIYAIACVVIALYLVFANNIISTVFANGQKFHRANLDLTSSRDVRFALDSFTATQNITNNITLNGWFFVQNDETVNELKDARLILKGEKGVFVSTLPINRGMDIVSWLENSVNVNGLNFRTRADVSTVPLPNGKYDLWVHIVDTGGNERYVDCEWILEKNGIHVETYSLYNRFYDYEGELSQNSGDVRFHVDSFGIDESDTNCLRYGGWFVISPESQPNLYQLAQAELILENETQSICVPLSISGADDLMDWLSQWKSNVYGNEFRVSSEADLSQINNGDYRAWVRVVDEAGNERLVDLECVVEKDGSDIKALSIYEDLSSFDATGLRSSSDTRFWIETFAMDTVKRNQLNYQAWFVVEPENAPAIYEISQAELVLDNGEDSYIVPLPCHEAPDIVENLGKVGKAVSGSKFRTATSVDFSDIKNGTYRLWGRVTDSNDNERYINLKKVISVGVEAHDAFNFFYPYETPKMPLSDDVRFAIDKFEMNMADQKSLEFEGWFIIQPKTAADVYELSEAELILKNDAGSFGVQLMIREGADILEWLSKETLNVGGSKFRASLSAGLESVPDGEYQAWFKVEDKSGKSRYVDGHISIIKTDGQITILQSPAYTSTLPLSL